MSAARRTVSESKRPRASISWTRDPAGMPREERLAELALILALGVSRLKVHDQNLQFAVEDPTPVEPLCVNSPVNSREKGGRR